MRKFTLLFLTLFVACICAKAQDAAQPLGTAVGEVITEDEDYGESVFPAVTGVVGVELYDGYVILRGWSGVEGRDLKVTFDAEENVTQLQAIRDGKAQDAITSAGYIYTGLDDPSYIYAYVGNQYAYASYDEDGGYVFINCYIGSEWSYYYCAWEAEKGITGEVITDDPDYGASVFPAVEGGVGIELYDGYVILRGWSGVEGRDLKVSFDADDNVTEVQAIRDGVEQAVITSAGYIYTGLDDPEYIYVYVGNDYSYAGYDEDGGYVFLNCYIGSEWSYYYCSWGEDSDDGSIYTAIGEVKPTEGWGETPMPVVRDVEVVGFDGYVRVNGFAGVEGYDLVLVFGENDSVESITAYVNDVEAGAYTSGDATLETGLEEYPTIVFHMGNGNCYGSSDDEDASGYFITKATFGAKDGYYFITWPQSDVAPGEWVDPFEAEATLIYTAVGSTGVADDWGPTVFPETKDIKVRVYDTYIYIEGIGGVAGYDAMVAYDDDEAVLSMKSVVDGKESAACKEYLYIKTGLAAFPTIQAYNEYSYAGTDNEVGDGYVLLGAYIYNAAGEYEWSYYYLEWENGEFGGIQSVSVDNVDTPAYNVLGQPVDSSYKGIVIKNGKKMINR